MKRRFEIAKTLFTWLFMSAFLVVGVVASVANQKEMKYQSNLKFKAVDVKAGISVYEGFCDSDDFEKATYGEPRIIRLDEKTQTLENMELGEDGVIEFKSSAPNYFLKIEVENQFAEGGRDILFNYEMVEDSVLLEISPEFEIYEDMFIAGVEQVETTQGGEFIIEPGQVFTFILSITLNTDAAEGFETNAAIDLLEIELVRG